ncbi:MAG: CBS domain-containing protein, partial [Caldisericaceae bacterium]
VITVPPDTSANSALKTMIKMGFSGLPVEENGKIIGMLSKRDLEKALLFEKRERPVKQFFTPVVATVSPDADLREVESVMIKNNVGRVLVFENDKVEGIISRSDLLKAYKIKEDMVETSSLGDEGSFLPTKELTTEIMLNNIDRDLYGVIKELGEIASNLGQKIYLVGGYVRDMFLSQKSSDLDFILSDDAVSFGKALKEKFNGSIVIYPETQTVTFKIANYNFDFVTARREYYNEKSLIPIIEKATLQEDLKRRDFTINTLAIDLTAEQFGKLYDFFGGYTDLIKKKIRVLHSYSFTEDPSRILRAIKYFVRFNFSLSEETEMLLKNAVELGAIKSSHSQRILTELYDLLNMERAVEALIAMDRYGILKQVFGLRKLSYRKIARLRQSVELAKSMGISSYLALIDILIDGKSKQAKTEILNFFALNKKLSNKFISQSEGLQKFHKNFDASTIDDKLMILKDTDDFMLCSYLTKATKEEEKIIKLYLTNIDRFKVSLKGRDLIQIGLKEGPQFSKILETLQR